MRLCGLLLAGFLHADGGFGADAAQAPTHSAPLTIQVLDRATVTPVTEFAYGMAIGDTELSLWVTNHSADGTVVVSAPRSCQLTVGIHAGGFEAGAPVYPRFVLRSNDAVREVVIRLDRSRTVRGTVLDARTRKPVAGAAVAPVVFMAPLFEPDWDRSVTSSAAGQFELQVSQLLGLGVAHPDYLVTKDEDFGGGGKWSQATNRVVQGEIRIETGEVFTGRVLTPEGTPLAGVEITDGAGKSTTTGADGSFILKSPKKWHALRERSEWLRRAAERVGVQRLLGLSNPRWVMSYFLRFEKQGFVDQTLYPLGPRRGGMKVVLQPEGILQGQVVNSRGAPVTQFEIVAGPGADPADHHCVRQAVTNEQGRFRVQFAMEATNWFCVKAPGLAFHEAWLSETTARQPQIITVGEGVPVRGRWGTAGLLTATTVTLRPARPKPDTESSGEPSTVVKFAELTLPLPAEGGFAFTGVRPDRYVLEIVEDGGRRGEWMFVVLPGGLDLGTLSDAPSSAAESGRLAALDWLPGDTAPAAVAPGMGRLEGQVFDPPPQRNGSVWPFARGEIAMPGSGWKEPRRFQADENGHFVCDSLPCGTVRVSIPFWETSDIGGAQVRLAKVAAGQTTEVRFFGTNLPGDAEFQFDIGDGSPADLAAATGCPPGKLPQTTSLLLALQPLEDTPASWPEEKWNDLDFRRRITLPDVRPARYCLRVRDWHGSIYAGRLVAERVIEPAEFGGVITVPMPASSVIGHFAPRRGERLCARVTARSITQPGLQRRSFAGEHGFVLRFLSPGAYTVFAHDNVGGWCRVENVRVEPGRVTDIGSHPLAPGGQIEGTLQVSQPIPVPDRIEATSIEGVTCEAAGLQSVPGGRYAFANLWPGQWEVTLWRGTNRLARTNVVLRGQETASANLEVN